MDRLPLRRESMYTDIEKFEEYEFTNCIAYEMAIRNDDNKELIKEFVKEYVKNVNLNDMFVPLIMSTDDYRDKESQFYNEYAITLMDKRGINPSNLYIKYLFTNDVNELINEVSNAYQKEKIKYHLNEIESLKIEDNEKYLSEKDYLDTINFKEYLIRNISFFQSNNYDDITKEWEEDNKKFISKKSYSKYFRYDSLYEIVYDDNGEIKTHSLENRHITPMYQRPKLLSTFKKMKTALVDINLSLPENELVDYIKKIKTEHDKSAKEKNPIIKTTQQLLGEYLEEYSLPNNYPKKSSKDNPLQIKWADWFFVYDYFKFAQIENPHKTKTTIYKEIDNEFLKYHDNGGVEKDGTMNYWKESSTYRKIIKTMEKLIDDINYKELLVL